MSEEQSGYYEPHQAALGAMHLPLHVVLELSLRELFVRYGLEVKLIECRQMVKDPKKLINSQTVETYFGTVKLEIKDENPR